MSATVWTQLLNAIHASSHQVVVAVTGGGSKAISQLLEIPGASQTLLEAVVPYSSASLASWLGGVPDQACSAATARAMAMAAWMRARQLSADFVSTNCAARPLIGLAATASLASKESKRGEHRIHVAVQTTTTTNVSSLVLTKELRDRKKEEWLTAKLLLVTLGEACGIETQAAEQALASQLRETEIIERSQQASEPAWTELLLGQRKVTSLPSPGPPRPQVIFPGSFNPPHLGHRRMAEVAAQVTGESVAYELSITNVDKPPLDYLEMHERSRLLQSLDSEAVLLMTDAPTFRAKSELFPGCTFVVGADTMLRIADPRYYQGPALGDTAGDAATGFEGAIEMIAGRACRFLVFGRQIEGRFQLLRNLTLPAKLRAICEEIPAEQFREDISSSTMRDPTCR